MSEEQWQSSACILCSINCGVEVQTQGGQLTKIRGDKAHPGSQGYTCEKAFRLNHYQQSRERLQSPMRRKKDGTFEPISWDIAIQEIAARFVQIRDTHGGESIFYYGGGGQGNHLCGAYGRATRAAMGSVYSSNALAQEKTGEFWVDGQLFGRPRCHTTGDFEHAEVAVFVGKNPWQSHGFPRARVVLNAIHNDPTRAMIVIDPRRTETAALSDFHLQVKPGTDVFCLSAMVAVLLQEKLYDQRFIEEHCRGFSELTKEFIDINVAQYCSRAGVDEELLRSATRRIAQAKSVSIFEDLGIQQSLNSTLNSYLEKLLYLLTGNFAKQGAMNIHTRFVSLGGGGGGGSSKRSPVTGHRIIAGLIPGSAISEEILTDHPKRFRAMLIESANPVHSLPDSQRMREALAALELVVVIDVAMTETARQAHYVLPASSQFEKWEITFFNLEFPKNVVQLRAPVLEPLAGTLPEAEIHKRLVRAMKAITDEELAPLHEAAAQGREVFAMTFLQMSAENPKFNLLAPVVLYETLGPTLPKGAEATAAIWGAAHSCAFAFPESLARAGFTGEGLEIGEALFNALLQNRSGVVFTVDPYEETWHRLDTPDKKLNLAVPELFVELRQVATQQSYTSVEFPFVLAAGERRTSTANTIFRDASWRRKDSAGALRIHPSDANKLGVTEGSRVKIFTQRGSVETIAELSETLQPGYISLPNGQGLSAVNAQGDLVLTGAPANELTSFEARDPIAGTPWHKHVPARVESIR
jgi:anaerobic selenocysteine-containing dehydrogenase